MKKNYLPTLLIAAAMSSFGQTFNFPVEIQNDFNATTVQYPPSPLKYQKLFIGGKDMVQHTAVYGNPAGEAVAKEQNDFVGFTPATEAEITAWAAKGHQNFLGWLSINHEATQTDDKLGDGGGMTVFAIKRDANDSLIVVPQTLNDGRTGLYFNVDFVNTVGETGMNCGGIASTIDGRIWTAEEWFRTASNVNEGFRHGEFTIDSNEFAGSDFKDKKLAKHEALNWMVEIDPRQAVAIRKQYNWGRAGWEGGAIANDNRTVYLGEDDTPGRFVKFVADVAGDFTKGKTYVYKHDAPGFWVEIDNLKMDNMVNLKEKTIQAGMTMFNRLEWVQVDKNTGMVYMAETGNDNVNTAGTTRYKLAQAEGPCHVAPHFAKAYRERYKAMHGTDFPGTDSAAIDSVTNGRFSDYYGRVLQYNPMTHEVTTLVEGGPYFAASASPAIADYPSKHFSNPDGLGMLYVNGKTFLILNEDLNGRSFGRMPAENNSNQRIICESYLLDLSIENPTVNDLIRYTATNLGAEIYGCSSTPDGKTIFVNNQHPDKGLNTGDYAYALTYAITGWDEVVKMAVTSLDEVTVSESLKMWPNPVARELNFNKAVDAAIYDVEGKRMKVSRNSATIDVQDLIKGTYFIRIAEGETLKLIVE